MKKNNAFNPRMIFLLVIIIFGIFLFAMLFIKKIQTKYESTYSVFFQLFGNYFKTFDRLTAKVIPVDSLDEKELGQYIALYYEKDADKNDIDYIYLNKLISYMTEHSKKPFKYRVFILDYNAPNAAALPGGVILTTRGLLDNLQNEGQMAAILAHEIGHIELEHCFDLVKFELLERKTGEESVGALVDYTINMMLTPAFGKTIESEADVYAFDFIIKKTSYDPYCIADAFKILSEYEAGSPFFNDSREADIFNDYFLSHPLLALRIENYENEAKLWWQMHKDKMRYTGKENYIKKVSFFEKEFDGAEWIQR